MGDYKLIVFETGWKKMLFNIKDDPAELKDLSKEQPEKLAELYDLLKAEFKKLPVVKPFGGNKLRSGKIATGRKGPSAAELAAKAKAKEAKLKEADAGEADVKEEKSLKVEASGSPTATTPVKLEPQGSKAQ